jgi:hypothetical protein
MSGEAMQMRPQLAKLASLHKVAPASFAPLPFAAPVDYPVTGLASTVDLDQTRMKFRGWCFPILLWQKTIRRCS